MSTRFPLSKTSLQLGAQCPRMLWFKYNATAFSDMSNTDEAEQEQFVIGDIVDKASQTYFADEGAGVVIAPSASPFMGDEMYKACARTTAEAMMDPSIKYIAQATFYTGDIVVFADLLHRNPDGGWDIIEVKSSSQLGPVHVRDAAWQTYVARTLCGVDIKETYLMHPYAGWQRIASKSYTDPEDFEIVDDYSGFIKDLSLGAASPEPGWLNGLSIPEAIRYLQDVIALEVPPECECEPGSGMCCSSPYRCNYVNICQETYEKELREQEAQY